MRTNRQARQSNLELLRIVAMLLIVSCHFSTHGGFQFPSGEITVNRLWAQFLSFGGYLGVDLFVLISGYFLINAVQFKTSKALKLVLQTFTYSVLFFAIFTAAGVNPFDKMALLTNLFPITYSGWWFASSYFMLYLLSPYLNKLLRGLQKDDYQKMLALLTVIWCILPTFSGSTFQCNNLLWFIYLYSVSAYIRLHVKKMILSSRAAFLCTFATMAASFLAIALIDVIEPKAPFFSKFIVHIYHMQHLPSVLTSLFLFFGFLQIDIGSSQAVNMIASTTFGIYLIHENNYVRPYLWRTLFKSASFSDSPALIPYSIAATLIVFSCCALIELLRMIVLERHYMGLVQKLSHHIDNKLKRFFALGLFKQ